MEMAARVFIGTFVLVGIIYLVLRFIMINISMFITRRAVTKNPTEEGAMKAYLLLKKPLGVSINNHPKDWAKYRDMFYQINRSPEVPSELKKLLKERLMKKGLYIDNMRIIDNYKNNTPAQKPAPKKSNPTESQSVNNGGKK